MLRPPWAKLYSAQTWIQLTASEAVNCDAVAVTGQPHWKEQTVSVSILKTSLEIIPSIVDPLIHWSSADCIHAKPLLILQQSLQIR